MPGIVECRSDQVVHRRIDNKEPPACTLFDVYNLRDHQSGRAAQHPSGLEGEIELQRAECLAHQRGIGGGLGRGLVAVADAEAAPEIEPVHGKPGATQFEDQLGQPLKGLAERAEPAAGLRADMHRQTDGLNARQLTGQSISLARFPDVDAELVFLLAGGDLGVGQRVDIGIDPDRDPGGVATRRGERAEPLQFGDRLDIDLVDSGGKRGLELGAGLTDAGEDDAVRRDAGGQCAPQFALRDDVGAGPEPGEDPQHREVRVGLHGIADQWPLRSERLGKRVIARAQRAGRVEIERRADGLGDARDRHPFGKELAIAIGKEIRHSDRPWDKCWARRTAAAAHPSCRNRRALGRQQAGSAAGQRQRAPARRVLRDAPLRGAPQDEGDLCATSKGHLILRSPQSGRLEGRTASPPAHSRNLLRAALAASRTRAGAVPPKLARLATERSTSSAS